MTKYIFKLFPALFIGSKVVDYDELEHKLIVESLDEVRITITADTIEDCLPKVNVEIQKVLAINFIDIPRIKFYEFRFKLIKIETT